MALDIQFTYPQQVIQVSSIEQMEDDGATASTLRIRGDDFSAVDAVLINDIPSPEVVVVDSKTLFATVPSEISTGTDVHVVVVSYAAEHSNSTLLSFQAGKTNRTVTGLPRLVQVFLKLLLTTPGSNIFSPTLGGGLLRGLGRTFAAGSAGSIVGDVMIAVDNTSRQLVAIQARRSRIPREERLLSAQVLTASFDASQTALIVSLRITSQAMSSVTTNLVL